MRTIDRYIAKNVLHQTLVVMGVLLSLFAFLLFIDQLNDVGTGRYGLFDAVKYVLYSLPRTLYDIFPMAALLGSILGMSHMALDSELVVIRAAGVSVNRMVLSVFKIGAVLALAAMVIGEVVTPHSETAAQRSRAEAMQQNINQQSDFGLWIRDNMTYVNVGEVLPDASLLKVRVFEFDRNGRLRSLVYARTGTYQYGAERWRLQDIKQTLIETDSAESKAVPAAYWSTDVGPEILSAFLIRPDQLSAWYLNIHIHHLRANNQDTSAYELAFWSKVMTPLATATMVILAVPFVFSQVRSGSFGRNLFIGIMLGLVFFVTDKGFGYVVQAYRIWPFFGAILPTLIFVLAGLILLRRVR